MYVPDETRTIPRDSAAAVVHGESSGTIQFGIPQAQTRAREKDLARFERATPGSRFCWATRQSIGLAELAPSSTRPRICDSLQGVRSLQKRLPGQNCGPRKA